MPNKWTVGDVRITRVVENEGGARGRIIPAHARQPGVRLGGAGEPPLRGSAGPSHGAATPSDTVGRVTRLHHACTTIEPSRRGSCGDGH